VALPPARGRLRAVSKRPTRRTPLPGRRMDTRKFILSDDDGAGVRDCAWAEVIRCVHARMQACGAAHPVVAFVAELIVGLCKRESNQPRPGVAPGCPQPMLRAQPRVCGAESVCTQRCSDSPKCFCTGKRRPRRNDGLEIGSYQTRPARHSSKRKIMVRGTGPRLHEAHA